MRSLTRAVAALVLLSAPVALSACASAAPGAPASATGTGSGGSAAVDVVASTDVYGSIAQLIGGDRVQVTSIIHSATQDPHSYEATTRDQLAVSQAAIVLENGAGYDHFVDAMLTSSGNTGAAVLNAVELSGLAPAGADPAEQIEGFNEHVWYSFPAMQALARSLSSTLSSLDPAGAATFSSNEQSFSTAVDGLSARAAQLASAHGGQGAAITEPVPLYLLEAAGLTNKTPEAFSEAIEEGSDVAPAVLQQTLALFSDHAVVLLAYNEQTASAETEQLQQAAQAAGIPVVSFTETLPEGKDYLGWMSANLDALGAALG